MAYEDLLKDTSRVDSSNSNYFLVTITDIDVNQSYPIQFRWKYNDGTFSPWSAVRVITTPGESDPNTPKFTDSNVDVTTPGFIKITWDGTSDDATPTPLTDIDRVDVYIDGLPFDGNKPAATFKTAGTQVIAAPGGTYQIVLYAVSKLGKLSPVSAAVTKTVSDISNPVVDPEDPEAPTVTSGLASVIVEWSGKKSGGVDFPTGSFTGAKVFIGTSAGFTPSDNNWVHTLNFANGSNKVSIGVGTVIDKTAGTLLQYNTPYHVKIDTINANGTPNNNPIAASGNPITVNKVAASEIKTGFLSADAQILAGISGGARVELSGSTTPFVIYGTGGQELLKFISSPTPSLTVNGGGTFTGDLSAGSGTSIFKSDSYGIYLGNATESLAPFSVSRNGILRAEAGTIGGWHLGSTYFQNALTSPTIKIDTTGIIVGSTSNPYIDITSSGITHRNANGTASGKFTLTTGASAQLTIDGTFTISGSSTINGTAASTVVSNAATGSTAIQSGNGVTKNSSNQIVRIGTEGGITISTASSGSRVELTNTGFYAYSGSTPTVSILSNGSASFAGTVSASSGNIGTWNINATTGVLSSGTTSLYGGVDSTSVTGDEWCIFDNSKKARFNGVSVSSWGIQSSGTISTSGTGDIQATGTGSIILNNGSISVSDGTFTTKTQLYANGRIFADYLGTSTRTPGSGVTIIQDTGGFLRVYVASSSQRYKENITSFDTNGTYNIIKEMRPVKFNYKPEFSDYPEQEHLGLIAEEVHGLEANGDLVIYKDGIPDSVAYEKIPMYLVSAFKEMANKIDSLQSRLDDLEA